jgi:uncharacterized protein with HEPN domain
MKSARTATDFLQDILDYSEKAMRFVEGMPSADALSRDDRTLLAVVRALEVIGEAAKRVPQAIRDKYPNVPWRGMTGMRDKISHDYFGVDAEVVWRTIQEDLPALRVCVAAVLEEVRSEGGSGQGRRQVGQADD